MPTIKTHSVIDAADPQAEAKYPGSEQIRVSATPGKPAVHYW